MDQTVVFSEESLQHFESIFSYLEEHFSLAAASNFAMNVHAAIQKIARYPEMYPNSAHFPEIRFYRMDKSRRIYYDIHDHTIRVLAIFDTRQHPDKNPY